MANWIWNESLRRYRDVDSGRILSFSAVHALIDDLVDVTVENVTDTLSDLLADGRMNVADWKAAMVEAIKYAYIEMAELGAGGRDQMTPAMWGSVGGALAAQYRYLDKFAEQIADGELSPAQIRARSEMYINSARSSYWRVRDRIEKEKGMTEELWVAQGDKNTCSPCFEADSMGWQPIGTFSAPGSGSVLITPHTECAGLTKCRCTKLYR